MKRTMRNVPAGQAHQPESDVHPYTLKNDLISRESTILKSLYLSPVTAAYFRFLLLDFA